MKKKANRETEDRMARDIEMYSRGRRDGRAEVIDGIKLQLEIEPCRCAKEATE